MFRGSAYCQLICEPNKQKRLEFAREHRNDNFANIVFTDECSVQLESHRRQCCRKQGEPAKNKPPLVSTLKMMTSSSVFPQGTSGEGSRVGWHKHEGKNRHPWSKTSPESPDLNPIENMWRELKEYLRKEVKPRTKDELVGGIQEFWSSVSGEKCHKYIRHLHKVIPRVIELGGAATGY